MIQKILIGDDEKSILFLLKKVFVSHGFCVYTASDAAEFEKNFFEFIPDLILLDILFGSDSGPDVYDRVMKTGSAPKTPVIFMSGLVEPGGEKPMIPGRQVALYGKPFDAAKMVQDIRAAFDSSVAA